MIDGTRTGEGAGAEFARLFPFGIPAWALPHVARLVLAQKRRAGYAHLDPEQAFLAHFPGGYQSERAIQHQQKKQSPRSASQECPAER